MITRPNARSAKALHHSATRPLNAAEVLAQFRSALLARGIVPPEPLLADGRLHRCDAVGPRGRGDAAYLLHLDGLPAGGMENWRDGLGWQSWRAQLGRAPTASERAVLAVAAKAAAEARSDAQRQRHEQARQRAERIWSAATPAPASHPYLLRKGVMPHGLRVFKGVLVVPLRDGQGQLHSLQFISAGGAKRFLKGGRVEGFWCWVGAPIGVSDDRSMLCVAEGFATAASVHQSAGHSVAVAFHAGNLEPVALALRVVHPTARIVICADEDAAVPGNPGRTQAMQAASRAGAWLAVPHFSARCPPDATDFNDLHQLSGPAAVLASLENAMPPPAPPVDSEPDWPSLEPLPIPGESRPYPIDALPTLLRDAILEVQAFVQAPMALVANSALAALSLAAQGLANVRRDHALVGPVSLYLLTVAESGERKSTCDRIFGAALREWERDRAAECQTALAARDAAEAVAEAKRTGLLESIRRKHRDLRDSAEEEAAMQALAGEASPPAPVPRLLYADATPEALSHALATGWPSAAVLSAEAGAVFGAHAMGYEAILRNLALLNVLWDGGGIDIDRRSKPSFRLRDRRLTFGVMVQPDALRAFIERAGSLPRGSGFLARFLIAWPSSTQGHRPYRPAPDVLPAVEAFNRRIRSLLDEPLVTDAQGGLVPPVLALSPAAHAAWVQAHDAIERQLAPGGHHASIRDVAAKAAENIARMAALFQLLQGREAESIDPACLASAAQVVAWHLNEAQRLLGDLDAPPVLSAAMRLDAWLCAESRRTGDGRIPTTHIYHLGPGCVRVARDLHDALAVLAEHGRARLEVDGRRRNVLVNPLLYGS